MFKFKEELDKIKIGEEVKQHLMDLEKSIESLKKMEVGLNISTRETAFDLVLTSTFDNVSGLNFYRDHSEHIKVIKLLKALTAGSAVVDYIK